MWVHPYCCPRLLKISPALLSHTFEGHTFLFREDGYINMTKAAKAFGKQLNNFWKRPETKEYMKALAELSGSTFKSNDLKQAVPGNRYVPGAGTYGHPKLAVFFARWLDVRFAVWCDLMMYLEVTCGFLSIYSIAYHTNRGVYSPLS